MLTALRDVRVAARLENNGHEPRRSSRYASDAQPSSPEHRLVPRIRRWFAIGMSSGAHLEAAVKETLEGVRRCSRCHGMGHLRPWCDAWRTAKRRRLGGAMCAGGPMSTALACCLCRLRRSVASLVSRRPRIQARRSPTADGNRAAHICTRCPSQIEEPVPRGCPEATPLRLAVCARGGKE